MRGRLFPQELVLPRLPSNYAPITCKQLVHMATLYKENEMPTNLAALCARHVRKCLSFRKLNWGNVWQQLTHCTKHSTVNTRSSGHTSHRSFLHTACLQILTPPAGPCHAKLYSDTRYTCAHPTKCVVRQRATVILSKSPSRKWRRKLKGNMTSTDTQWAT